MIQLLQRPRCGARFLLLSLAFVAACSTGDSSSKQESASGDVGATWSPANLTAVNGVPLAALRAAVGQRLDGKRPDAVGEEAWKHTRNLYKRFGQTPLWLVDDGLAKDRAGALTNTALRASDDGLRIDDYPIGDLANEVAESRGRHPGIAAVLVHLVGCRFDQHARRVVRLGVLKRCLNHQRVRGADRGDADTLVRFVPGDEVADDLHA